METLAIHVKIDTGLFLTTGDGTPLTLAALRPDGTVLMKGDELALNVFTTVIEAHEKFWEGEGHLEIIRT